jgi:alkylation response protein AidB-like acyl-CoA dehydrogenase
VRFSFTAEQQMAEASVRGLLAAHWPAARLRERWAYPDRPSTAAWQALADAGVLGLRIPAERGGAGLDEVDLILILEETGRAALADPIVEVAAVLAPLIAELGDHTMARRVLPRIAEGRSRPALGLTAAGPNVLDADTADLLILQDGDALHAVDRAAITVEPRPSVDGARRLFRVTWTPSSATLVLRGDSAAAATALAMDRGSLGTAAQLLGLADHLITVAASHARDREQFGRPIGSFQAIKHLLADALLQLAFARPLTYRAAWSVAHQSPDRARDVSMAVVRASAAAQSAARTALQVYGAIGYTWEHDLHLWMKRVWGLSTAWGGTGWHERRIITAVLGGLGGPSDQGR